MNRKFICSLASKGALQKAKYIVDGNMCLVKGNSKNGNEAIAEVLVSNLLDIINIRHIRYYLDKAKDYNMIDTYKSDEYVSVCKIYEPDVREKISLYKYILAVTGVQKDKLNTQTVIDVINELPDRVKHDIMETLWIDAIVCNVDRHLNNIDILINKDCSIEMFPMFDFGDSLWHNGREVSERYTERAKPIGKNHLEQVRFIKKLYRYNIDMNYNAVYNKWLHNSENILKLLPIDIRNNMCYGLYKRLKKFRRI